MADVIKIVNEKLDSTGVDKYLRERHDNEKQQKIQYLLELLRNNPKINQDMLRPDLKQYFGIAKREYIKELNQTNSCIKKR